jgi:UPF0755 protein
MKKLALVLAILMTGAVALASMLHARAYEPFRAYAAAEQIVTIPRGTATPAIGRLLVDAGVVRDVTTFRVAVWLSGDARRLQAGEYRFDRPLSALDVLAKIARGDVVLLALTFPEGLTIPEMAAVFESSGFGAASDFAAAAEDGSLVATLDPAAGNLEGYLFPDTYTFPRGTTARAVVERMVDRFDEVLTPDLRDQARGRYLSVRQLVTLASLVEKETARSDERPTVAGVYANRLRIGMPLQCDPTVIYALQQAGRYDGNIRRADLAFESPYNTYRYPGLPPGPIAAPGQGALEAAAAPAEVPYLYFVSRNDGSHVFARTLAEHNRNVRQYQIEYFREQRRRAREEGR